MSYVSTVLADSPVSYWRFDETSGTNAADQQGAHAGTYTGTYTLNVAGALGGSGDNDAAVNLTNGYINTSYAPFVAAASQTFECWVNSSTPSGKAVFGGSATAGPSLWFDSNVNLGWYPQNSAESAWSSVWPGDGVWVYVVLTWNDTTKTAELFINGVSKGAVVCTQAYGTPGNLQMGALKSVHSLGGSLDEFAVYSSILSATQIANHYRAGTTSQVPNIVMVV